MPDGPAGDQKKGSLLKQIMAAVVIALIAGGTAPWWYSAWFSKGPTKSESTAIQASHEFMVGRWQLREATGSTSTELIIDLSESGRLEGTGHENGSSYQMSGTWDFERLSDRRFVLWLVMTSISDSTTKLDTSKDRPERWTFEIVDRNHIRAVEDGSVAERVP